MPRGYGVDPDALKDLLPWSYASDRLAAARNYWVASASPDGRPHVAPVWGLWLEDTFYFSTDPTSRKARNLAADPRVVVHLESGDEVVILEGRAERLSVEALPSNFVDAYEAKYQLRMDLSNADYGLYRVRPRVVHAWREQDFPASATSWRFPPSVP